MAEERDSLLREVDEELRREQMEKFWKKNSGLILGGAVALVVLVAGYQVLESRRIASAQAGGAKLEAAMSLAEQNKEDEASKAFEEIAKTGPKGYANLAKLHVAGAQIKAGKTDEALATYQSLADDAGADPLLKNFAQLQAASLRMGQADFTEMQNRLNSLTADSSPFRVSARELLGFAAYKAGKTDEARKLLEPLLIDPAATRAIQDRIKVVMADIAAKELAAAPAPAAPAEAGKAEPAKTEPAKAGDAVPAQK